MTAQQKLLNRIKCVERMAISHANPGVLEQLAGDQYKSELISYGASEDEHLSIMQSVQAVLKQEFTDSGNRPGFPRAKWEM